MHETVYLGSCDQASMHASLRLRNCVLRAGEKWPMENSCFCSPWLLYTYLPSLRFTLRLTVSGSRVKRGNSIATPSRLTASATALATEKSVIIHA